MDDGENDFDRIAKQIQDAVIIVWAASEVIQRENDVAKALCAPALHKAVQQLNGLQDWVEALSQIHKAVE